MSIAFPTIKVNGELIPPEAFAFELSRLVKLYAEHNVSEAQIRQQLHLLRSHAIEQTISAKLLIAESQRLDIKVPEEDIDQRLAAMIEQAGGDQAFDETLKKQGHTRAKIREEIRRGRRTDLLIERIVALAPDPTEEQVLAHFEAHREEYSKPEQVLAQHILVEPEDKSEAARAAARAKLEAIRARVAAGAKFAKEAEAHSDCPSSADGGDLGWVSRGMMVEAFDRALFALETDELSEIIETEFGFHIIYKADYKDSAPADFDDARDAVREFLRHAARSEVLAAHAEELRAQATIEEVLAK